MEVLEEEELREMARQQAQFHNLVSLELQDIQKMEAEEKARLEAHKSRKGLERTKRENRINSHQKIVSRQLSKDFLRNCKGSVYKFLKDTSLFYNPRVEVTLKSDVMPWILGRAESFVKEYELFLQDPTPSLDSFAEDTVSKHAHIVTQH